MKRKGIALLLAASLLVALAGCGGNEAKVEEMPKTEFAADAQELAQKDYGDFTFSYPSKWTVISDETLDTAQKNSVVFSIGAALTPSGSMTNFNLVLADKQPKDVEKITEKDVEATIAQVSSQTGAQFKLDELKYYTLGSRNAVYFAYSGELQGIPTTIIQMVVNGEDCSYVFTCNIFDGDNEQNVKAIFSSIQFK